MDAPQKEEDQVEVLAQVVAATPSLQQLGYRYTVVGVRQQHDEDEEQDEADEARLVSAVSGRPYAFVSSEHHEVVGAAVAAHVQRMMTRAARFGPLHEVWLPDYKTDEAAAAVLARLALGLPAEPAAESHQQPTTRPAKRHKGGQKKMMNADSRPPTGPQVCKYGFDCFCRNEKHRQEFLHPPPECAVWRQQVRCNVFLSPPEVLQAADRLLVVICGMGPVRAGQWARKLCMNETLETGSLLPYLARAKQEGYAVLVLNPNLNHVTVQRQAYLAEADTNVTDVKKGENFVEYEEKIPIPCNENGFKHITYVWDQLITPSRFSLSGTGKIAIIAHSFGGNHALSIMQDRKEDLFNTRSKRRPSSLGAIAFIDSVHTIDDRTPPHVSSFLRTKARHWVKSSLPLDTPLDGSGAEVLTTEEEQTGGKEEATNKRSRKAKRTRTESAKQSESADGCERVSAGSDSHDHCPSACLDSVFRWLGHLL